jgi:AcrR family transcriptional regulator
MTDTKDKIQSVAIELFHQKGYFATSMSEIAQGCGIQKAGIYYHFASKEELLFSIMKATMEDLIAYLQRVQEGIKDVETRVRAAVRGHVEFHLRRQKENFIANSELRGLSRGNFLAIVEMRDRYERVFQDLIQAGRNQGLFGGGDVKILSYAILAICTAGAPWYRQNGRLSVEEIATIYEDFVIKGLKHGTLAVGRSPA